MIWTEDKIAEAKLALSRSATVAEAAGIMSLSGPPVSAKAIVSAFLARGLSSRDYLHAEKAQANLLARAAGAAATRYSGGRVKTESTADRIAGALGVDPEAIRLGPRGEPPKPPELRRAAGIDAEWVGVALISDTHVGHECAAVDELQAFLRYAHGRGVRHVVHAGDLLDGTYWFRSAHLEQVQVGLDKQISEALRVFPELPGLSYWFLGGNHDSNGYWRTAGVDPVLAVVHRSRATGRDDIHHLGNTVGRLVLGHGDQEIRIEAAHPEKGAGAYALSYGVQKYVEALQGGSKPHLLVCGHMHAYFTTWLRGVWCCMPGCWQWQTEYERRKALHPAVGGVIAWIRRSPYAIQVAHEWHGHHAREVEWIHATS